MTEQVDNASLPSAPASGATPPKEAPIRVLVVDDEREIRRIFRMALEQRGFGVGTASSARKALQILMQQTFDVLVVDLKMQEMSGIVFVQEALKIWPWLGVIIVSGYVTDEAIQQAAQVGVLNVLTKPVGLDLLCRTVREEAESKRQRQGAIPTGDALALMRNHLNLLTRIGQNAIGADTLFGALLEFGNDLADLLPASVIGILVIEDQPTLLLNVHKSVTSQFLATVEAEILRRFHKLSGQEVGRDLLNLQVRGEPLDAAGVSRVRSVICVPVMLGHDFRGLLALADDREEAYAPADVSLLYHAANHISAAFMALRKMHHLATRDPLTGVFNRLRLEEELERAWLISRRYNYSMAVIIIDIDHFKTLNDSYGHSVGDEVLRDFAKVIGRCARATDVIGRYGGDEFVAILPRAEEHDARSFGERLLSAAREHVFCRNSHNLSLTISIGIATSLSEAAPPTSGDLLSQADRALYTAKRGGRNRTCVWPDRGAPASETVAEPAKAPEVQPLGRIMVIDDEQQVRDVVSLMLSKEGYAVSAHASADEALAEVSARPGRYDVVLTDLGMPGKSGIDLLREVTGADGSIIKVVLTGHATVDNAIRCLREGAYDFIQKPVVREQLAALMQRAMELRDLRRENARHQAHLEETVRRRSAQLASSLEEVRRSYEFTLEALVALLDAREHQAGKHSLRTRELTVTLARRMGITGDELHGIANGALLHDIGKIGIPDAILLREGPLLPEQWEIMRQHPDIGFGVLKSSPYLKAAAEIVHQHQERYDGRGYPLGLKGDAICVGARIFAVIDAYDSMRSLRVYRRPLGPDEALDEIRRCSGTQFDPDVVDVFLSCQEEMERILTRAD